MLVCSVRRQPPAPHVSGRCVCTLRRPGRGRLVVEPSTLTLGGLLRPRPSSRPSDGAHRMSPRLVKIRRRVQAFPGDASASASDDVLTPRVCRGRLFSSSGMASTSMSVRVRNSSPGGCIGVASLQSLRPACTFAQAGRALNGVRPLPRSVRPVPWLAVSRRPGTHPRSRW
jgi:hypothetical protein